MSAIINNLPKGNVRAPQGAIIKILEPGETIDTTNSHFNNNSEFVFQITPDNEDLNGYPIYIQNGLTPSAFEIGNKNYTDDNFKLALINNIPFGNITSKNYTTITNVNNKLVVTSLNHYTLNNNSQIGYLFVSKDDGDESIDITNTPIKNTLIKTINLLKQNKANVQIIENNQLVNKLNYTEQNNGKLVYWKSLDTDPEETPYGEFGYCDEETQMRVGTKTNNITVTIPGKTYFQSFWLFSSESEEERVYKSNYSELYTDDDNLFLSTSLFFKNGKIYVNKQTINNNDRTINLISYPLNQYNQLATGIVYKKNKTTGEYETTGVTVKIYNYNTNEILIQDVNVNKGLAFEQKDTPIYIKELWFDDDNNKTLFNNLLNYNTWKEQFYEIDLTLNNNNILVLSLLSLHEIETDTLYFKPRYGIET